MKKPTLVCAECGWKGLSSELKGDWMGASCPICLSVRIYPIHGDFRQDDPTEKVKEKPE